VIAACLVGAAIVVRLFNRPPRCPECQIPGEPVFHEDQVVSPLTGQITYRCPACEQVIGRRYLTTLAE
jgi:predicted RNA-binding Zn-ribbon protein involved in translation (DUF1610 family)